jgi:hypothetical protein
VLLHVRIESSTSPAYGKCCISLTDGSWPYLKTVKIKNMKMGEGEVTTIIIWTIMGIVKVMMMVMIVMRK